MNPETIAILDWFLEEVLLLEPTDEEYINLINQLGVNDFILVLDGCKFRFIKDSYIRTLTDSYNYKEVFSTNNEEISFNIEDYCYYVFRCD